MSFFTFFLVFLSSLKRFNSQSCLSSPPEVTWDTSSGTSSIDLTIEAGTLFSGSSQVASFTTRLFNGTYPGPTLRFQRGNEYKITYYNNLGPEAAEDANLEINTLRSPNHTNLHTHGLHISGEEPGDYVFHEIAPGDNNEYIFTLPNNHNGAMAWYHPHFHGSSAIQVLGGAVGAIIVDENATAENLPNWLVNMTELVLIIQLFDLEELDEFYSEDENNDVDNLFSYDTSDSSNTVFTLVNGEYNPTICMDSSEWLRLRISYISEEDPQLFTINGCELYLLAKDSIWIHGNDNTVPRPIMNGMWFTAASRAEVAIYCPSDQSNDNITYYYIKDQDDTTIATIQVNGIDTNPTIPATILTPFEPTRPSYIYDLMDYTGDMQIFCKTGHKKKNKCSQRYADMVVTDESMYGIEFDGNADNYLFETTINTVLEFELSDEGDLHPFHMHVNHFQLISGGIGDPNDNNVPDNWTVYGDYLDTVYGEATIRFKTDTYGGHVALHCHILEHEDEGAMAVFKINGGCKADGVTDYDETGTYESCGSTVDGNGSYIYDVKYNSKSSNHDFTFITFFVTMVAGFYQIMVI